MTNVVLAPPTNPPNTLDGSSYGGSMGRSSQLSGTEFKFQRSSRSVGLSAGIGNDQGRRDQGSCVRDARPSKQLSLPSGRWVKKGRGWIDGVERTGKNLTDGVGDVVVAVNKRGMRGRDCLKDLVSHKQSGNPTFSIHKEIASPEVISEFYDSKGCTFLSEELPDIDSFNDIHPHFDDDPLSGSTTFSANSLLEEFADELALISYPPDYDDYHACDIVSDIREIEFCFSKRCSLTNNLLIIHFHRDLMSILMISDDSFDSEGEKIKEAELLIDPLDLPCDILSEYDSFNSQDFSRDDVLFSPDNEDK
nr:hypothetical protein [Tanacetum cinerariifolium]